MWPRAILSTFIALLIAALAAPTAAAGSVKVLIAHRGLAGGAEVTHMLPENSIPAWQWAIDNGAQIVDMDTQITSDGTLAVMHDSTINRTTNRSGSVAAVTLDYIKGAWLELPVDLNGNGDPDNTPYHPPSLNQALDYLKPKKVNNKVDGDPILISLEIKGAGWSQAMLNRLFEVINGKSMVGRVIVHSARPAELTYAENAHFLKIGYVTGSTSDPPPASTIKTYGPHVQYVFLRLESAMAKPGVIDDYNKNGLNVCLSILSNPTDYSNALALGDVYAWVTDDVKEAKEFLNP
jgi:glycerophosphoryl diester phosphodiesterase